MNNHLRWPTSPGVWLLAAALPITSGSAAAAPDSVSIQIDATRNASQTKSTVPDPQLDRLVKSQLVCLNLRVKLDGAKPETIKRSAEEVNPNAILRDIVPCGPGLTGLLPMGPGIEYYLAMQALNLARTDLSIYPGSRTTHTSNDVSCVFDEVSKDVLFQVRGLFRTIVNRFQEVGADQKVTGKAVTAVQLRPVVGTPQDQENCKP